MVNDTVMVIVQRQNLKIQFQFFNDVIDGDEYFQFGFFVPGISWARDEIHTQNDKHEIGIVIRCKIIIQKNVAKDEIVLKIKYDEGRFSIRFDFYFITSNFITTITFAIFIPGLATTSRLQLGQSQHDVISTWQARIKNGSLQLESWLTQAKSTFAARLTIIKHAINDKNIKLTWQIELFKL